MENEPIASRYGQIGVQWRDAWRGSALQRLLETKFAKWILVLGWMAVIFWLSSQPEGSGPPRPYRGLDTTEHVLDYMAHAVAFGVLMALAWRAVHAVLSPGAGIGVPLCSTVFAVMLYAASDEYHQSFVPGRHATVKDWLADAAGMLVVVAVVLWREQRRRVGSVKRVALE